MLRVEKLPWGLRRDQMWAVDMEGGRLTPIDVSGAEIDSVSE
jgi:hypothetical protein